MDAYDAIGKAFIQQEAEAKEVYRGDESVGRRALKRILVQARLDAMLTEVRETMVYQAPPELGSLWTKFEAMWKTIVAEQDEALKRELSLKQAQFKARRATIARMKERAVWAGAVIFVILWMLGVLLLIRTSHTFRSLS